MRFKQQWTSFWERQQEAFELHLEARHNSSFLEEFIASDPVNGPIVKATERKILYGSLGISSGVGFSLLANLALHLRQKLQPTRISPFAAHFGVTSYLLREKDRMDAYVIFNEWLQKRAA